LKSVQSFKKDVDGGSFPSAKYTVKMNTGEKDKLLELLDNF
jgi:hypothetical protein